MKTLPFAALILCMSLLGGCATLGTVSHTTSNLVDFLYPKGQPKPMAAQTATLKLPVRVGIAFVPASTADQTHGYSKAAVLNMAEQNQLLSEVARHFSRYRFVKSVEVIPDSYLMPGGGFNNLDAIASMYGVDIIALVSYDQVQTARENAWSLLYLTVIGAYYVPAEKNTTTTFVDTAVFDVASRKLLFRAPGIGRTHDSAAIVNQGDALRAGRRAGFEDAFRQMIGNLDNSLATFKQKVKSNPQTYKVAYAPGYSGGGGAIGFWVILLALVALFWRAITVRIGTSRTPSRDSVGS
ncbi:MAG TPA: rhombotarget lipoprotein [Gammaproteobacteria bacterium]|nr:rhombotarget lipoprotein [Gammaproteobacteria bacterium]